MKKLIDRYAFDASARTITFDDYTSIDLNRMLIITNATDNIIIFNFTKAALGGTVAANVLTLLHDTTSMADTDSLQIFYEESDIEHSTWGYVAGINGTEVLTGGKRILEIAAMAWTVAGTFTIDGGDTITIPADTGIDLEPEGALIDPTVVFDANVDSYVITFVS